MEKSEEILPQKFINTIGIAHFFLGQAVFSANCYNDSHGFYS